MTGFEMIKMAGELASMLLTTKWESELLRDAAIEIKIVAHTALPQDRLECTIDRMDHIDYIIDALAANGLLPTIAAR